MDRMKIVASNPKEHYYNYGMRWVYRICMWGLIIAMMVEV